MQVRTRLDWALAVLGSVLAEEVDADLIVISTHGRKGLDRVLMGSVSTGVMHRARQAVLVVR